MYLLKRYITYENLPLPNKFQRNVIRLFNKIPQTNF